MVDLKEPLRREYSMEENLEVNQSFLILLFYFLAFYLTLHNLIIPLALNLFRGHDLLLDVHFWFLFSFPLIYWVKKKISVPRSYLIFLFSGSVTRIILYSTVLYVKSWTIASVYLTEFSLIIYCVFVYHKSVKDKFHFLGLLGIFIPYGLSQIESHSIAMKVIFPELSLHSDLSKEGCVGSQVELSFPVKGSVSQTTNLKNCGFATNTAFFESSFSITNEQDHLIHLRLFKLSHKEGKLYWKFVRLLRIEGRSHLVLDNFLKKDSIFLLKAPERRNLGILVLIPEETALEGKLTFTPDMIKKETI